MVNKLYASRGGRQVYDILISETPSNTGRLAFHVEKGNTKTIPGKEFAVSCLGNVATDFRSNFPSELPFPRDKKPPKTR
jgi:hypothetical protein